MTKLVLFRRLPIFGLTGGAVPICTRRGPAALIRHRLFTRMKKPTAQRKIGYNTEIQLPGSLAATNLIDEEYTAVRMERMPKASALTRARVTDQVTLHRGGGSRVAAQHLRSGRF